MITALLLMFMMPTNFDQLPGLHKQTVKVSWYGEAFAGKITASGETFDPSSQEMVAHKSLPFGTKVFFENPENGKVILGVVKDRGPYIRGREFDLSEAGAEALGFKDDGVAKLEVVVLPASP